MSNISTMMLHFAIHLPIISIFVIFFPQTLKNYNFLIYFYTEWDIVAEVFSRKISRFRAGRVKPMRIKTLCAIYKRNTVTEFISQFGWS